MIRLKSEQREKYSIKIAIGNNPAAFISWIHQPITSIQHEFEQLSILIQVIEFKMGQNSSKDNLNSYIQQKSSLHKQATWIQTDAPNWIQ